jgi:3-hydroxyisobutyrate dehydrogenase
MRQGGLTVTLRLGFVGLGIMGQAMAKNLLREEPLTVYNRTRSRTEPLREMGARVADKPRAVAQSADICFVMVSNDQALSKVVEGAEGILAGMASGSIIVDHSTVSPKITRHLAEQAQAQGVEWCDAPVTGGDVGAKNATLTVMAGADEEVLAKIRPFIERVSQRLIHVGPVGQGQTLKLVSNLVSCLNLMAGAEGVRLGLKAGLEFAKLEAVMPHGSAQSYELAKILDRFQSQDFAPGFSVENRLKDLDLAVDLADSLGQSAPLGHHAKQLLRDHFEGGHGSEDESSYLNWWDR